MSYCHLFVMCPSPVQKWLVAEVANNEEPWVRWWPHESAHGLGCSTSYLAAFHTSQRGAAGANVCHPLAPSLQVLVQIL